MSDSFAIPWTIAQQVPLSVGFPRQAYWTGLPFPSQGDLSNPDVKPAPPALQAESLLLSHREAEYTILMLKTECRIKGNQ